GAYALTVTDLTASVPNLLTGSASNVQLHYDPSGNSGQELAQIGSLSGTLIPLNNATVTASNLDIFDNGFTLGGATLTAPSITLGKILSLDNPSLTFTGVGYNAGAFTGTIGVTANSVSLFPGQSDFSATADTLTGSYTVASQTATLSAEHFDLSVGKVLDAKATQLNFT